MKKLFIVLISICCFVNLVSAGEPTPKTKAGDKAMLFTLSGLTNLSSGNYDGGIGIKYYMKDEMAIRGGVGFGYENSTLKGVSGAKDLSRDSVHVSFSPAVIFDLATGNTITAFVGGTTMFTWGHSSYDNPTIIFENQVITVDKLSYNSASFGLGVLAGFDWFPWENISVGCEYSLLLTMTSSSVEAKLATINYDIDFPNTTGLGLNSNGSLTLGVYF